MSGIDAAALAAEQEKIWAQFGAAYKHIHYASDTYRQWLETQLARTWVERDALAAALKKRKGCRRCGGTGRYLAYPPTTYETDTEDEVADAIRMAERSCPDCAVDPQAILAAHDAEVREKVLLEEWQHDWPVIFKNIADEDDVKLSIDAQQVKHEILEAINGSKFLAARFAEVRKPLEEELSRLRRVMEEQQARAEWAEKTCEALRADLEFVSNKFLLVPWTLADVRASRLRSEARAARLKAEEKSKC